MADDNMNMKSTGKFASKEPKPAGSSAGFSLPSSIPFSYAVVLFIVFLVAGAAIAYFAMPPITPTAGTGTGTNATNLTDEQLKAKVENYLNTNFLSAQGVVGKVLTVESSGSPSLAKLNFQILQNGEVVQEGSVYASRDGTDLVLGSVLNLNEPLPETTSDETTPTETPAEVQKSEKPNVDLYVMSFCPYGVQAEQALSPVIDLLGEKANIDIKFIVSLNGETINDVVSLHGSGEAMEDLRQVCIDKLYPEKYWDYLDQLNAGYSNGSITANNAIEAWDDIAISLGMDVNAINACVNTDGMSLILIDNKASTDNSVSGSPTFIINGTKASVARTPEGIKQAICGAFTTPPEECSTVLSETGAAASGNC